MQIKSTSIELVSVNSLIFHPKNMNSHSDEQIDRLIKLIEYQGFRNPLVVQKGTNHVVAGNGRLMAARKMGLKEVPVTYQEFESEAQLYAYIVSDNAIASWSELDHEMILKELETIEIDDIELLGIEEFEIPEVELLDPQADEDEVPEVVDPITKRGDIWLLGKHRLMCGDSTMIDDVEKLMNGEKADMVFTDPPYGVAVNNTQGNIIGDEDLDTFEGCLPLLKSYSQEDAHFYVWCASGDMFPPSIALFMEHFDFQNILPIRCTHENKRGKKGAFKLNFETCLFGNNNTKGFNPSSKFSVSETTLNDSRYKGDGKLRVYPALWDGERSTEHNMNIVHPTQKKVEMIEFYVEISSNKNELVLDLFGGSGSTMMACEKQGRLNNSMEFDEKYCDVIINRWQNYTGKKATLESNGQTYDELKDV